MSIYKKLQEARIMLQNTKLKKSGHNKFANYYYFELGDFLPEIQNICQKVGMCGVVAFNKEDAYLTIYDTDDGSFATFTSPMSSAALKGCHDVQNLGAVQTYLRRYLWVNAFEIVEHDALEPLTGKETPVITQAPKVSNIPAPEKAVEKAIKTSKEWHLIPEGEEGSPEWIKGLIAGANVLLETASTSDDVANIFKNNRSVFDIFKAKDEPAYSELMSKFSETKKSLAKE
jgi:hypothetical protein